MDGHPAGSGERFCGYSPAIASRMPDPTQKTITTLHGPTQTVRQKRRLVLRAHVPAQAERVVEVTKTRITIGRSRSNQLVLEHESVSSAHAELHQIDERIVLVDSGSRNGSWVNDRWVQRGEIFPGDELRFGEVRVVLVSFDEIDVPISSEHRVDELWGSSAAMREVFAQLMALGASDISLLLTGETGTGKELAARAVHVLSARSDRPFTVVDCGSLVPTLAVSALFGHAKGAFTGADRAFPGAFEVTEGGTILLDEIGELSLELQTMLLRVLDRGEVTRLGEQQPRKVDVRVIAATHRSLSAMVAAGTFREDLYFRLVEGEIELPPLRRRKGDVAFLAQWFLAREGEGGPFECSPPVLHTFDRHTWPGNVRELRNVLRRAVVLARAAKRKVILERDIRLLPLRREPNGDLEALVRLGTYSAIQDAVDRAVLPRVLEEHAGVVAHAAQTLGISRRRLKDRLVELGLHGPSASGGEEKK